MKRRNTPYELDFVAEKCIDCQSFEWGNLGRGLCWAEECFKLPLKCPQCGEQLLAYYLPECLFCLKCGWESEAMKNRKWG